MLSSANGWELPSDDEVPDSPLPPHDDSGITGEVDGGRARRQLAWACTSSWSACPRRARSCPHPLTRGLLARSDHYSYSCQSSGWVCNSGCDHGCYYSRYYGWRCNQGCDTGCFCHQRSWTSCDSGCTAGCYACPYGTHSAASTSLVWPPRAMAEPRAGAHSHHEPHTRLLTDTTATNTPRTERVRAQALGRSLAIMTAIPRPACRITRWSPIRIGDASRAPS